MTMIFIGNFLHLTNQQEISEEARRHGEFNLIVEAGNIDMAIQMFKARLVDIRETKEFFEGECSIFLVKLLEFDMFPMDRAMMLNFKSVAGDPIMPYIECIIPSEDGDFCRIYDWENNRPEIDGQDQNFFMKFS